jgi:hypothetical protein
MAAIVAAFLVVRERGAVAGRQFLIDKKAVRARVVAGIVNVLRRQVLRRPQRPVRDAGMQDGEVGIAKLLRRYAHLRIRDDGCPATWAELRTVAGREDVERDGGAERRQERCEMREADFHAEGEVGVSSRPEYKALRCVVWQ